MNQTLMYRPAWEITSESGPNYGETGTIVLFAQNEGLSSELSRLIGQKVILVQQGDHFRRINEFVYELNPVNEKDYWQLFQDLKKSVSGYTHIAHLWSLDHKSKKGSKMTQMDRGLFSIFKISRVISELGVDRQVHIVYMYFNSEPTDAAVGGFQKSLHLEHPQLRGRTVGVDSSHLKLLPSILQKEIDKGWGGQEVRYSGKTRQVKKLVACDLSVWQSVTFKHNGIYLITGGMGGIGFQIALYLAKVYHAKLILSGRSPLHEGIHRNLDKLKKIGAKAIYIQSDISVRTDVEHLIRQARIHFGQIHGILHCAGEIRDSLILRKKLSDIREVIAPKVSGTIYLDEETKDEPLDWFVLFSSISGEFGNRGQCDYAYANSFMDNFSYKRENMRKEGRRHGKTLSINWPMWKNGGIQVDEPTRHLMKETLGLDSISSEQGVKILENGLAMNENHLTILHGDAEKINAVFFNDN
ncbi:SDR family NAD(P)-dependent oxidoreductase [Paenibacillus polymyxa]|uniref:SDR family NAD(P)-dependent oxidoreductase n=2 Tax=Paenibacillus polymyxa TaxID=1406 RepID=UPI001C9E1013|nr:SDR family NAD(P)-dependent oxidoreductase [Paenibacillus polymyxa]MBY7740137.1 SDR family NAD(P)-dependent oxidoreductase [Paenibacillus polymyxa]